MGAVSSVPPAPAAPRTYECPLCLAQFPIGDMISMLACEHKACLHCTREYFIQEIDHKAMSIITCHTCPKPDFNIGVQGFDVGDYLGLLDELLRTVLVNCGKKFEQYDKRLRDLALSKDPDFKWCGHCPSGYIVRKIYGPVQECPDCHTVSCKECNVKWEPEHKGKTCEEVMEERRLNAELQLETALEKHLQRFGIQCPKCSFRFELAKGGCLHFRCLQCRTDFCGGCYRNYSSGAKCKQSPNCANMGLHAHHPRNCFHYTRDMKLTPLHDVLQAASVKFAVPFENVAPGTGCVVVEQQIVDGDYQDVRCPRQRTAYHFCEKHYKEYLADLIFKNKVDVLDGYTDKELEQFAARNKLTLTPRTGDYERKYHAEWIALCKTVPLDQAI